MSRPRQYTPAQLDFLRQTFQRYSLDETTARFNRRFGTAKTRYQIKGILYENGIRSPRPPGYPAGERWVTWSPSMIDWLRRHRASGPLREVTARFNRCFGVDWKDYQINNACKRHRIRGVYSGQFPVGNRPWNYGLTGYSAPGMEVTQFAPGNAPHTTLPIGAYRQDAEGYWLLKVSADAPAGLSRRDWRNVHHLTWEAAHGPIPRGQVVVFLDGDPDHCLDPASLACINRAQLARLNQLGWGAQKDPALRAALFAQAILRHTAHQRARAAGLSLAERRSVFGKTGPFTAAAGAAP